MIEEMYYTTEECAEKLNLAYGWKAVNRQRIHRDIDAGRLEAQKLEAAGSRERAGRVQVRRSAFLEYSQVYHRDVWTALKTICNN